MSRTGLQYAGCFRISSPHVKTVEPLITRFMGPIWDRQDPGGPHVGPMNLAIWDAKQDFSVDFLDQKIIFWYNEK